MQATQYKMYNFGDSVYKLNVPRFSYKIDVIKINRKIHANNLTFNFYLITST